VKEIKVTWSLVWSIWWRFTLISLAASIAIWLITLIVAFVIGTAFLPW
jgi:hypothetical protein